MWEFSLFFTLAFEAGSPGNQAGLKLAVFEDDLRLLTSCFFLQVWGLRGMYRVGPSSVSEQATCLRSLDFGLLQLLSHSCLVTLAYESREASLGYQQNRVSSRAQPGIPSGSSVQPSYMEVSWNGC